MHRPRRKPGTREIGAAVVLTVAVVALLSGCRESPVIATTSAPPSAEHQAQQWRLSSSITALAKELDAPWSVVPFNDANGGGLISERDSGRVLELQSTGGIREVGIVPAVVAGGEGGLNGLAVWDGGGGIAPSADCGPAGGSTDHPMMLYAYHRTETDNRVVRMVLRGGIGEFTLGPPETVIEGIPGARNHNGGRIAFGPDGCLYVATGDAGDRDSAQDPDSLSGKILRLTPEGEPAPGNPHSTAMWTLGHRNVEGLAWTSDGTMWASEFGENSWDELNRIEPGMNYGWPMFEGRADDERFADPAVQWAPAEASPSGLAAIGNTLFLAALRGQAIWTVDTSDGEVVGEPMRSDLGESSRWRDIAAAPDDTLWLLSNNTDGRGTPGPDDDRLLRVSVVGE